MTRNSYSLKVKHRKRLLSKEKYKKKLQRQSETITSYPAPCYPRDKYRNYTDKKDEIAYYQKTYKSSHTERYKYYKKFSNRAVRRYFKIIDTWEYYCYHEEWMDKDPEYMALYCDEYGWEWDVRDIVDIDPKYDFGNSRGAYKKVFDYWWNVD